MSEPKQQVGEPKPVETEGKDNSCQCPLCQRFEKFFLIIKQLPESDAQWMKGFYESVFEDETEHSMLKAHYEELTKAPHWLPVSQCDLKAGEGFWAYYRDGMKTLYMAGFADPKSISTHTTITHFMRCEGVYRIPDPPVVEKEDDGFEEFWTGPNGFSQYEYGVEKEIIKAVAKNAWLARGEQLKKEGK